MTCGREQGDVSFVFDMKLDDHGCMIAIIGTIYNGLNLSGVQSSTDISTNDDACRRNR